MIDSPTKFVSRGRITKWISRSRLWWILRNLIRIQKPTVSSNTFSQFSKCLKTRISFKFQSTTAKYLNLPQVEQVPYFKRGFLKILKLDIFLVFFVIPARSLYVFPDAIVYLYVHDFKNRIRSRFKSVDCNCFRFHLSQY